MTPHQREKKRARDRRRWARHSKRLNRQSNERWKRRRDTDPERVLAQRRQYRARYCATHRDKVRAVKREAKRRERARLKALTVEQIVQLIKRRGEHEWPSVLIDHLLRKLRKRAKDGPQ